AVLAQDDARVPPDRARERSRHVDQAASAEAPDLDREALVGIDAREAEPAVRAAELGLAVVIEVDDAVLGVVVPDTAEPDEPARTVDVDDRDRAAVRARAVEPKHHLRVAVAVQV